MADVSSDGKKKVLANLEWT